MLRQLYLSFVMIFFVAFSSFATAAWAQGDYVLYEGDYNGDGRQDLILYPHKFILISGDVNVPFFIDSGAQAIVLQKNANGSYTYISPANMTTLKSLWKSSNLTISSYNLLYGDLDGDSIADIVLQPASDLASLHVIKSSDASVASFYISDLDYNFIGSNSVSMSISGGQLVTNSTLYGTAYIKLDFANNSSSSSNDQTGSVIGLIGSAAGIDYSGAVRYEIPLRLPSGINGLQPNLSLSYNSYSDNGLLGIGWEISGQPVIRRCRSNKAEDNVVKGISFASSDKFCLNGNKLLAVTGAYGANGTQYKTNIDNFERIYSKGGDIGNPDYWEVITKSGERYFYGQTSDSKLVANAQNKTLIWSISSRQDAADNMINYTYTTIASKGIQRPKSISYAGTVIDFNFRGRSDSTSQYLAGQLISRDQRLTSLNITNSAASKISYSYQLSYEESQGTERSLLSDVKLCGNNDCVYPLSFTYQDESLASLTSLNKSVMSTLGQYNGLTSSDKPEFLSLDANADGYSDIIKIRKTGTTRSASLYLNNKSGGYSHKQDFQPNNTDSSYYVFDVNGDGLEDFAEIKKSTGDSSSTFVAWFSDGQGTLTKQTSAAFGNSGTGEENGKRYQVMDMNGDTLPDLVKIYQSSSTAYAQACTNAGNGSIGSCSTSNLGSWSQIGEALTSNILPMDTNGDGQQDLVAIYRSGDNAYANIWSNNGSLGFTKVLSAKSIGSWSSTLSNTPTFLTLDVNADGLSDIVKIKNSSNQTYSESWLNTDLNDFVSGATTKISSAWFSPASTTPSNFSVLDVNFDGSQDLVHIYKSGNYSYSVSLINNDKGGFYEANRKQLSQNYSSNSQEQNYLTMDVNQGRNYLTMDVNADGTADLVEIYQASTSSTANANIANWVVSGSPYQDKLIQVNNVYGTVNKFNYGLSSDRSIYSLDTSSWPTGDVRSVFNSYPVAYSIDSNNGSGGFSSLVYRFYDQKVHIQGLGNQGFARVQTFDLANDTAVVSHYSQDSSGRLNASLEKKETCTIPSGFKIDDYSGLDYCADFSEGLLERERHEWQSNYISAEDLVINTCTSGSCSDVTPGSVSYSITKSKSLFESFDLNQALISATSIDYSYDNHANPVGIVTQYGTSVSASDLSLTNVDVIENNSIEYNSTLSLQGIWLKSKATTSISGPSIQTSTSGSEYEYSANGLLTKTISRPGSQQEVVTTYSEFDRGLPRSVIASWKDNDANASLSSSQAITNYEYDVNGAVSDSWNALGHHESFQEHPVYSVIESHTNANGQTTTTSFDILGRKISVESPQSSKTFKYGKCSGECSTNEVSYVLTQTSEAPSERSYFDSLGRTLRTGKQIMGGNYSYIASIFDSKGQLSSVSEPYLSSPTHFTQYTYDARGRNTRIDLPAEGRYTELNFSGLKQTNIDYFDGSSQSATTEQNAFGMTIYSIDNLGNRIDYQYNGRGQLVKSIDMDANQILIQYDDNGARTQLVDPDKGTWTFINNALGQVTKEINANGQVTSFNYDLLGRMLSRVNEEGSSYWEFDQATNGVGQISKVTQGSYIESLSYDGFGNLANKNVEFGDGNSAELSWHYIKGKLDTLTYPGGYKVKQTYDSTGYLNSIHRDDDVNDIHWQATSMDARGKLTAFELDGGLKTYREYDAATGFATSIESAWGGIATAQKSSYKFDGLGNLTYRDDQIFMDSSTSEANQDQGQSFTYDSLNRLSTWTSRSFDGIGTGGDIKSMSYMNNGNILSKAGIGSYQYQQQGSCEFVSGPHAVSYIEGKGQYCYDISGNLLNGDGRSFTYTSFGKPKTITQSGTQVELLYGPNFKRYKRIDTTTEGEETTWYLDGLYEKVEGNDGALIERFYLGSFGFIERSESAVAGLFLEQTRYFLKDHLGSVLAIAEGGSMRLLKQFHYDAWGKREYVKVAGDQNAWDAFGLSGRLGYTGHEMLDSVGLIHMNGRVYDPEIGRFISADPFIQDPNNSQSYNRYTYVYNNPLAFTDPNGYFSFSKTWKKIKKAVKTGVNSIVESTESVLSKAYTEIKNFGTKENLLAIGAIYLDSIGCAGYCSAALSAQTTYKNGGNWESVVRAGVFSYVTYQMNTGFSQERISYTNIAPRAAARGSMNGAYATLQGGDFSDGFEAGFKAQFSSDAITYYIQALNDLDGSEPTMLPGTKGRDAGKISSPYHIRDTGYNNIGIGWGAGDPLGIWEGWTKEGSTLMKGLNLVPGMNYMSAFHDTWAGSWNMGSWGSSIHSSIGTGFVAGSIIPAMGVNYTVFRKQRESTDYLNSL
ncbi:Rhs family protein [Marinomonas sp. MED121]|uniref:RHS repeat-associated core domain-containing protein n=1 Tax=Marinomonas sp. MED121 TaxID=314277 RepID=UPI000068FDFF|nr:RHS repeat-associated core domain-containing protein [Marinomonas sp. MED121]EAQ65507.1 Rhs family protein [Marinomonas sp. MED121]